MEPQERKRYIRQITLPEMGLAGQEKLKAAKVLVIGAGGLGCPVLQYLTAAGVGTIGIVDDDTVDITNLHRQILYSTADVGKGKAITAAGKLSIMNPFVSLIPFLVRLTEENAAEIISGFDLVIDGSDNFPTRYLANDICVELNKPLIFGSILRFEGQVSVFNYKGGPTYRCLFPEAEEGDNCEVAGVIGILPGIIGSYMANEAIKVICGIGGTLSGQLLIINTLTNQTNIFHFNRNFDSQITQKEEDLPMVDVAKVDPKQLLFPDFEKLLEVDPDNILLVDVREEYEFEEDFIGGINIPLPDLPGKLTTMTADKTVVFYCRSGVRSLMALKLLNKENFEGLSYWMKEEK
jgi:molybdopterin/thiamine biosynthesis adenylyltransferase/rhodanese-related sulfurtransferase